ncbi:deoxyribose-phosphate aldolase [Flavobacteriales bacterium 34_180_T64]|nr:deoxyribose-phosphate aldolase [Flavobacteriales bacterium 34_180_T64]
MNRILIIVLLVVLNCKEQPEALLNVQTVVDNAIEISGGELIDSSSITFNFRDRHYVAKRNNGDYLFARITTTDSDSVFDILSNKGFERFINDDLIKVPDSMAVKYSSSVNSVHYFSVLPYGLNDGAVNKKYIGLTKIKGQRFHKIQVTFDKEGGGEDFEDVFVYWINKDTYKTEYIAYSYIEDDGWGLRLREAYNERYVDGIRFVDYNNYKPKAKNVSVLDMDALFEKNQLQLVSKIELEKITVN